MSSSSPAEEDASSGKAEERPTITAVPSPASAAPPMAQVVERVGFGYAQIKAGLCGGGVWMADGAELLLISSVGGQVAKEWNLGPFEKGFIVTTVYLGILLGNCLSGPVGDVQGRRSMIIASYIGIFTFSILSSWAVDFFMLAGTRIIVGFFIGMGQPAWNALGSEISPAFWRMGTNACSQALFPMGEIYAAVLLVMDDPTLTNLHWRELLQLGALPSLVLLFFSLALLRESPSFLALKGRTEEAEVILKGMYKDNHWVSDTEEVDVSFTAPPPPPSSASRWKAATAQIEVVFSPKMFWTTMNVMYSCFCLNLAYYGTLYAFPEVLAQVLTTSSAASELIVGAAWEIVGQMIAFTVGLSVLRKTAIKTYLGLSVTSLILFCMGASASSTDNWIMEIILKLGYYGTKTFVSMGFIIVYQYATEIYPTSARITGSALNMAAGRLAAMLAPLIYELTVDYTESFMPFFLGIAAFLTMNALFVDWLKYETAGVALKDDADEDDEEPEKGAQLDAGSGNFVPQTEEDRRGLKLYEEGVALAEAGQQQAAASRFEEASAASPALASHFKLL